MTRVLICGAGKVGIATAAVFSLFPEYDVYLADNRFDHLEINQWLEQQNHIRTIAIDIRQTDDLIKYCHANAIDVIISTLLSELNQTIIEAAIDCQVHYIDCSPKVVAIDESLKSRMSTAKTAFMTNCGLAPGWTGIIANHFLRQLKEDIFCQVQVGVIADEMTHSLSGSAKRFMLELTEPASMLDQGKLTQVKPLNDVWPIEIGQRSFETTHAANGHGHLLSLWQDKVSHLSYQTLLPPGLADKIQFLIEALRLHEQAENMREILGPVFDRQPHDALWVRIDSQGKRQKQTETLRFEQVIHPYTIAGYSFTALQISTAIGIASVADMIRNKSPLYRGFIAQETMDFNTWLANRFTQLIIKKDSFYQQQDDISPLLNTTL